MATVTPPRRTLNLHEAQTRVRHPLDRIRGTIRTYVGLEGAALLVTLLALWFWVGFVLDFGTFRLWGLDWVQEAPRFVRALSLGCLFLAAVAAVRAGLIVRMFGDETRAIFRTGFGSTERRPLLPVWMRLPLVGGAVAGVMWLAGVIVTALDGDEATASSVASALGIAVAAVLPALHEALSVRATVSRLTPAVALGAGLGALFGIWLGDLLAGSIGAIIGAGLFAMVGDVLALLSVGVVALLARGKAYLVAIAVPAVAVYLALWVVTGLAAEYIGALAAVPVVLLLVGPVLVVVAGRLVRDFGDPAVALVLERRFPAVLGDRLITAVELADAKKAARYGYSEVMIEQTILDAAERVETVPVREVFDWKRLYQLGLLAAALTAGLYLVAGGLFQIAGVGDIHAAGPAGFSGLNQRAGMWAERNVLLKNTIWPRRAYLEALDFGGAEKRIGKDDPALGLHVRALKWVVAAPESREGWRALTWGDLAGRRDLLGEDAPKVTFPASWGRPRDNKGDAEGPAAWSLDEVELRLAGDDAAKDIDADTLIALRDVFAKLEGRAADPAMRRTLRMLIVPTQVTVKYKGKTVNGTFPLQRQGNNEYSGQFPDLKESVEFTVRGEDYVTPRYSITIVPPPALVELVVDEWRPAYMLYRTSDDPNALRGLKQSVSPRQVSVTGGDTSRIDAVPAGADLVLTAKSSKELKEVSISTPPKAAPLNAKVELLDGHTFRVRFDNVRLTPERPAYDFNFLLLDADGVKGQRHVVIKPIEDAPPDVGIDVKLLLKTPQGYMITPTAYVPLEAKFVDDHGLERLEYACTVSRLDRHAEQSGRGLLVLSAMHLLPGGPGQEFAAAARIAALSRAKAGPKGDAAAETVPQTFDVPTFTKRADEYLPLDRIKALLAAPRPGTTNLTKDFLIEKLEEKDPRNRDDRPWFFSTEQVLEPDSWADVLKARKEGRPEGKAFKKNLKVEVGEIQPRYRMQVWLEAVDNDVETGKDELTTPKGVKYRGKRGVSKEKITFVVVSENELLSEVAKEEEGLYIKLGDQVRHLQEGLSKLERVREELTSASAKPEVLPGMIVRADDLANTLEKGENTTREVNDEYQRLLKILVANQVNQAMIDRVEKQILQPLGQALEPDDKSAKDNFPQARASIAEMKKALTEDVPFPAKMARVRTTTAEAQERLNLLIRRLTDVLEKMASLIDINKIIAMAKRIEEEEARQAAVLKQILDGFDPFGK